jgi:hypothetical protein
MPTPIAYGYAVSISLAAEWAALFNSVAKIRTALIGGVIRSWCARIMPWDVTLLLRATGRITKASSAVFRPLVVTVRLF